MIALWLKTAKPTILAATAILVVWIAIIDWSVGNTFSLGILPILPMMLAYLVKLNPWEMGLLSLLCAFHRSPALMCPVPRRKCISDSRLLRPLTSPQACW